MKHTIEVIEKLIGHIEIEKMAIASSRDRLNDMYRDIEALTYRGDNAHSHLIEATEALRSALDALKKGA